MKTAFTAIDFETAQYQRWSICQVGLVRVENGVITSRFSALVQPPDNYYLDLFTDIHGISSSDTATANTFNEIWSSIEPFIKGQDVVAHSSAFDFSCLQKTLEYYNMSMPEFTGHCTYKLYNNNLASLCKKYKIPLNHHDALSDAMACAELFKMYLERDP